MIGVLAEWLLGIAVLVIFLAMSAMLYSLRNFLQGDLKEFLKWNTSALGFISGGFIFYFYSAFARIEIYSYNYYVIQLVISIFMITAAALLVKSSMSLELLGKTYGFARFQKIFEKKKK